MKDFKGEKLDTTGVIKAVKHLFAGQRELILGFNFFLPPDLKISEEQEPEPRQSSSQTLQKSETSQTLPLQQSELVTQSKPTYKDAEGYVAAVRAATTDEEYKEFLNILNSYQSQTNPDTHPDILERIEKLFQGHEKLIQGFKDFLPNGHPINPKSKNLTEPVPLEDIAPPKYEDPNSVNHKATTVPSKKKTCR